MTNKLVVIINSIKVPKIKNILLYEMKFLVLNYSCLQNPWLGGYRPQIPVLSVLCPQLNLLNPPPPPHHNSWVRHWCDWRTGYSVQLCIFWVVSLMITSDPCPWLLWCLTNCRMQMKFPCGRASWTHVRIIVTVWHFSLCALTQARTQGGGGLPACTPTP